VPSLGFKSVEIVQAYLLLTSYGMPVERFEQDRTVRPPISTVVSQDEVAIDIVLLMLLNSGYSSGWAFALLPT
jgi:hypothetical protein